MSLEAEQAILGGLMLDSHAWDRIADVVTVDDFARREHRPIFTAIAALASEGTVADILTVENWLKAHNEIGNAGGLSYLASIANNTPSAANIGAYARLVADAALERRLAATAGRIAELAKDPMPVRAKLDQAQALLSALAETNHGRDPTPARAIVSAVLNEIDRQHRHGGGLLGISTGYVDLDQMTSGLQAGDLVIVAGRPSMGKTTLAVNIAENAAGHGTKALIFSLEMSREQLAMRSMASLARLDFQRMRLGKLDDSEWPRVTNASARLSELPLFIDDTAAIGITEIRARARRLKREHGLGLILIDYLQLMRAEGENRNIAVGDISRGLKALAKELAVPVVALSQLNRNSERQNRKPMMSDLRDSGSLEQDADVIIFIHRDDTDDSPAKGTAEVIIGKQRNGPTGSVRLTFAGEHCRFDNYIGPPIENIVRPSRWSGGFDG